jgi:hypothetical protein
MQVKTRELTGAALDWAVAQCEGATSGSHDTVVTYWVKLNGKDRALSGGWADSQNYQPSTDWAHGGPIIERTGISVRPPRDVMGANGCVIMTKAAGWFATTYTTYPDGDTLPGVSANGATALQAAMRCYVAAQLGDTVTIPAELATTTGAN